MKSKIQVREARLKDISLIVDYWMNCSDDYLVGMGVDLKKFPSKKDLKHALNQAIVSKKSYALIWEYNDDPIGHTNVNNIVLEKEAFMHIHLWNSNIRKQGLGTEFIKKSLPLYFDNLQLETLYCEPYALNPAPNKALKKIGFEFVKKYTTIPGNINFEQEVNQWKMTKSMFKKNNPL